MTIFRTIVVDPPWQGTAGPLCGRAGFGDATGASRPLPYLQLSVAAISALPISDVAAQAAHLYLWTTNAHVEAAYAVARAWGFKPSTLCVWAKNPMGGGLGGDAFGISTEFFLFARRGRLAASARIGRTWFNWKRPYDERGKPKHSCKPPEFFQLVRKVSPGPFAELFAREQRAGWSVWGNEVDGDRALRAVLG
jgi:N6-adenosine-specific RNA methylase IME4